MEIALLSTAWVAFCGGFDLLKGRVPNGLMALGWIGAVTLRVHWMISGKGNGIPEAGITLAVWALAFTFWLLDWWGAADAKFVMALALAFPDPWMLLAMALSNLAVALFIQVFLRKRSSHMPRVLPAVTCLGAGWLIWAAIALFTGSA